MAEYVLVGKGRKIIPSTFKKLEDELGFALPVEYKAFISNFNGGKPGEGMPCKFWVQKSSGWQESVEFFYGVSLTKRHSYLPDVWRSNLDFMPRQLLPFAFTLTDDLLSLGLSSCIQGRVFFSSSVKIPFALTPLSTDAGILADKGTIQVARNFQEFLDNLM